MKNTQQNPKAIAHVTDSELTAWAKTYYLTINDAAMQDLDKFLHNELNIPEWIAKHYLKLPPDALVALQNLMSSRTGSLVSTLERTTDAGVVDLERALADTKSELRDARAHNTELLELLERRASEVIALTEQLAASTAFVSAGPGPAAPESLEQRQTEAEISAEAAAAAAAETPIPTALDVPESPAPVVHHQSSKKRR